MSSRVHCMPKNAPPWTHPHTHTRPHFSQTILQRTFLCLAENYLLAKMLSFRTPTPAAGDARPPAVPAHCSYITKHLCVRNALFILVAPGSFSLTSASCQSVCLAAWTKYCMLLLNMHKFPFCAPHSFLLLLQFCIYIFCLFGRANIENVTEKKLKNDKNGDSLAKAWQLCPSAHVSPVLTTHATWSP